MLPSVSPADAGLVPARCQVSHALFSLLQLSKAAAPCGSPSDGKARRPRPWWPRAQSPRFSQKRGEFGVRPGWVAAIKKKKKNQYVAKV